MQQESQENNLTLLQRFPYVWSSLYKAYNLSSEEMLKMNKFLDNQLVNNAIGCMFGAFMGDALGSFCQFRRTPFEKYDPQLDLTMQMPGKGTFNVKPGQFTDDSELAAHMLEALCKFDPKYSLKDQKVSILFEISQQYVSWYDSNPFDIGMATTNAMSILNNNSKVIKNEQKNGIKLDLEQKLKASFKKIAATNMQSCSNGSMMRNTPMAFFISLLLDKEKKKNPNAICRDFKEFIRSNFILIEGEINMTHGCEQVFESSYAWIELLVYIIARKRYGRTLKQTYENFITKYISNKAIGHWVEEALKQSEMDATVNQGWVKIAFTYGIIALKKLSDIDEGKLSEQNYIAIIKHVIGKAGDTDTNAAIVGGLVGAVLGFKRLPQNYLFKQFRLQLDDQDYKCSKRGQFYEPRRQFYKAMKLVEKFDL